jgi:DNA polymerase-3 subunit alpha
MYLIFDTETTGTPKNYNAPLNDAENWPRMVQLAWQIHDVDGTFVKAGNHIIYPDGFEIPYSTVKIHGISTERAKKEGIPLQEALVDFNKDLEHVTVVVGHNVEFDLNIVGAELYRTDMSKSLLEKASLDSMKLSTDFCAIPGGKGGKFKYPKLNELHSKLFGEKFEDAHNAAADVEATARCFLELIRLGVIRRKDLQISEEDHKSFLAKNTDVIQAVGIDVSPNTGAEELISNEPSIDLEEQKLGSVQNGFIHLHLHTQYSILDGMTKLQPLAQKAKEDGMTAVAITDHGTMFGVKDFHKTMTKEGIKPIIGMEVYMAYRTMDKKERQDQKRYHLVLLAKNKIGYHNLLKLATIAYETGFYYKPRIDKEVLRQYSEGLIALSACLAGEVPNKIMEMGVEEGEKALLEYKNIFGDDFYLEFQRHPSSDPEMNQETYRDQLFINEELFKLAEKHQVTTVATNDVHYLNSEDSLAHDRLVCLNTGRDIDDPNRMRYTGQEWFKTQGEMGELFADHPELIENIREIDAKIEQYELDSKPIMPDFTIPEGFDTEDDYLKHITYEGAKMRWGELSDEIKERLDFELGTIAKMGFPGYFLIVWDFLKAAREMGVIVGPGRGSAAGSAVAYCLKITDIDPLKYNLLFERFLNPDRISMPDIDIDFDDDGREKILEWVRNKYGTRRVAHISTFGSMAAKSSIRDVARVQRMNLGDADRLAKLVPERPGTSLASAFKEVAELKQALVDGDEETRAVLDYATKLEGSIRSLGTHACGIIIGKDDLDKYIPLCTVKDSSLDFATQYDGSHVESIGLLKMDFLGLKTLTIIKDAIKNVEISRNIKINIDTIPLDDAPTYELYSRGETLGLFQFESDGMRGHLRNLKPSRLDDLIAMNALYRPGPMDYIGDFVDRKHGRQAITYDLPEMEEYLAETYGITVYQEQVMLLSRKLAGFTAGQSDSLRKAMGKKIKHMMDELKEKFIEGCKVKGHPEEKVLKIWSDWEAFAKYAFNKSHATCYTYVSYQTAWLKTHYPAEFMASVLSHNFKDINKLNFYLNECHRMKINVLGPNINESFSGFTVNKNGEIRYGLSGIKGVGEAALENIIAERSENGPYADVFDFVRRVNLRTVNKKTLESLVMVGCFNDLDNHHQAQYFYMEDENDSSFLEKILKFGAKYQENLNSSQISLFGGEEDMTLHSPPFPECAPWSTFKLQKIEKELMGFYISGHPLDEYEDARKYFIRHKIVNLKEMLTQRKKGAIAFSGIVTKAQIRDTKNGKQFAIVTVEDEDESFDFFLFNEKYLKYKHLIVEETFVFIEGLVDKSYKSDNELEFKALDIMLLDEVIDNFAKEVIVRVDINKLNKDSSEGLIKAVKESKGNARLKLYFHQEEGMQPLPLRSMKYKVNASEIAPMLKALNYTYALK